MLTIYRNDIAGFSKEDWEDMLCNPSTPLGMASAWEDWSDDRQAVFEVDFDCRFHSPEWEGCPVKELVFDLGYGKGGDVGYSEELSDLLADIDSMKPAKNALYKSWICDHDFANDMDNVADAFCGAYDKALGRALLMLVKELYAARGE